MKFQNIDYKDKDKDKEPIIIDTLYGYEETQPGEKSDDKIYWSDVKKFLTKYKLVVWFFSVIPFGAIINDTFGCGFLVFLTITQLTAFTIMCWIGWGDIFERIRNLFN